MYLALVFPNLRNLVLRNYRYDSIEARREEDLPVFQRHGWSKLDYFEGTIDILYALAVSCPIGHLIVDDVLAPSVSHSESLRRFGQLYPSIQLTRLSFKLKLGRKTEEDAFGSLLNVLLGHPSSALTHLSLCIDIEAGFSYQTVQSIVVCALSRLLAPVI